MPDTIEPHDVASYPPEARADEKTWRDLALEIGRPSAAYPWLFAGLVAAAYWLAARAAVQPLELSPGALANAGTVLAPLVMVAAFIERAVEVILTPWRGDESEMMQGRIAAYQATDAKKAASESMRLRKHQNGTRRRAFLLAVALGLVAALLGFRGIGSLLVEAPPGRTFVFFDVVITGFVLAGGAEGIHKPIKAFTDYMEMVSASAEEKKKQAKAGKPAGGP